MKLLKYIGSVLFLAAATLAALYFPSLYFQKYQYETVIEEVELPSYDEPGSSKANLWQISKMLEDMSYVTTNVYMHRPEKTDAAKEIETGYIKMVQRVFEKYIKTKEEIKKETYSNEQQMTLELPDPNIKEEGYEGEGIIPEMVWNSMLSGWMEDWIKETEDWQVSEVTLLNLTNVFSGKLINIQLYDISFQMPNQDISMEICFSPNTELLYMIFIKDERYFFEENISNLPWEMYVYYERNEEPKDILEKYWNELMNIQAFENTLSVGLADRI